MAALSDVTAELDRKSEAATLYIGGQSMAQVSTLLDVLRGTVRNWLIELGIPRRTRAEANRLLPKDTTVAERRGLEAKLYLQGLTLKQIGGIVGRAEGVVRADLGILEIPRRKPGPRAGSEAAKRRGKHPAPTPRPCAYCGEVFTPRHATHVGKYCTLLCGNRARAEAQGHKRGQWRTCLNCGESFWRYQSQLASPQVRGDFCSRKCWGDYRWHKSDGASLRNFIEGSTKLGHFGTDARREWLGRFGGRRAPGPGGQPRGRPIVVTPPEKVARVHELAARGRGRRTIAQDVDLSEYTVRKILSDTSA